MMLNRIKMLLFLYLFLFSCSTKNSFEDSRKTSLVTFEINELPSNQFSNFDNVKNLTGGILAWAEEIDPSITVF